MDISCACQHKLGNCEVKKPGQTLVGGGTGSSWAPGLKSAFFHRFCLGCSHAWEMSFQLQITIAISLRAHRDLRHFGLGSCSFHLSVRLSLSLSLCLPPCLSLFRFLLFSVCLGLFFFSGLFFSCLSFLLTPLKGSSRVKFFQLWFWNGHWRARWATDVIHIDQTLNLWLQVQGLRCVLPRHCHIVCCSACTYSSVFGAWNCIYYVSLWQVFWRGMHIFDGNAHYDDPFWCCLRTYIVRGVKFIIMIIVIIFMNGWGCTNLFRRWISHWHNIFHCCAWYNISKLQWQWG